MENNLNQKNKIDSGEFFSANRIQPSEFSSLVDPAFADRLGERLASLHLDNFSNKKPMSNNKQLFKQLLFGAGGAFLGVLVLGVVLLGNQLTRPNTIGGELAYFEGVVEYKNSENGWMDADEGIVLQEGMAFRILGEGKAIINLDDGSVVRMDSDSIASFSSLDPKNIIVSNESGSMYTRVAKLDRDFTVQIDEDQYRSLGTAYKTINLENKKGVRVYESAVEVIVKDKDGKIRVEQGKKFFTVDESDKDNELVVADMSESEIEKDNFLKWNVEKDKEIEEYKDKMGILSDKVLPTLEISTPTELETKEDKVQVSGKTDLDARIKTNYGEQEINEDGSFNFEIEVPVGYSEIIIKAIGTNGAINEQRVKVTRLSDEIEKPEPTKVPSKSGLNLTGNSTTSGIKVNWGVNGLNTSKGFKVAYSTSNSLPSYPKDSAKFVDGGTRSIELPLRDGKTYYIRVCTYTGSGCGTFSNAIKVTAPSKDTNTETVKSLSLSSIGSGKFKWSVDGYSSGGYKLVWSKNSNPTYPNRGGDYNNYYSNPSTLSGSIADKDGAGTYYVRVCEYKDGKCGVYSNQVTFTFEETTSSGVQSINLVSLGDGYFKWQVNGSSENGYKLVWSKNSGPTYPTRSGDYANYYGAGTINGNIGFEEGDGIYNVRVCEYKDGKCGVYSNQVSYDCSEDKV
jgi:hypothetical protein